MFYKGFINVATKSNRNNEQYLAQYETEEPLSNVIVEPVRMTPKQSV